MIRVSTELPSDYFHLCIEIERQLFHLTQTAPTSRRKCLWPTCNQNTEV